MDREQMVRDARLCAQAASHNLRLLRKYPDKILPGEKVHVEGQLLQLIAFEKWERKNARRAGRTSLKQKLLKLIASILSRKEADAKC
ncbi:hypothetical protein EBB07_00965 [Paenibacillaceae bacterium]|nr:hypothetical protein EBB07_00965 [Paenibacillaceae bacterium]